MSESTVLSALKKNFYKQQPQKTVCIAEDEFVRSLLLFGAVELTSLPVERTTFEQLKQQQDAPMFSCFIAKKQKLSFVETEQFGEKEWRVYQHLQKEAPLLWLASQSGLSTTNSCLLFPKLKPWERLDQAKEVLYFVLKEKAIPLSHKALGMLAQKVVAQPAFLATDIQKYCMYVSSGPLCDEDIEMLIDNEASSSLWTLFDAFVAKNKKIFFEQLSLIEREESHPLQIIRFFQTQWEKLLLATEQNTAAKFKSQEKQQSFIRLLSMKERIHIVQQLLRYDIALRDGGISDAVSLVPFFAALF